MLIEILTNHKIPLFANVNIQAEFLEIYRRILIPESLCDFLESALSELGPPSSSNHQRMG